MSFCVAAFSPWPSGLFLPVGCWPLCVVQDFLNAMPTAQLRCDTGISPFLLHRYIHPPVGCRPRFLNGFHFPLSSLCWPRWPAKKKLKIQKQNFEAVPTATCRACRRLRLPPAGCACSCSCAFIAGCINKAISTGGRRGFGWGRWRRQRPW